MARSGPTTVTSRMVFTPLDSGARSEVVARRLAEAIRLGLLRDEERLPTETRLAAQLGVSTVTAREALATLRSMGLVETRRGRSGGSFVRAPKDHHRARLQAPLLRLSIHELRDLGDHRTAIAGAAAKLAAERALQDDVAGLREHFGRLQTASTLADRRRADARLHIEIAAAAQSPRLTREEMALWSQVGDLVWLPLETEPERVAVIAEHEGLIQAIADEEPDRARDLATRHVGAETDRLVSYRLEMDGR